jgi:hypothetical protein
VRASPPIPGESSPPPAATSGFLPPRARAAAAAPPLRRRYLSFFRYAFTPLIVNEFRRGEFDFCGAKSPDGGDPTPNGESWSRSYSIIILRR